MVDINNGTDMDSLTESEIFQESRGDYQEAVKWMKPEYTIVSVGKKPETDASNKYRNYTSHVFSTRWKGNMVFDCNLDGTVRVKTECNR